MRFQRDVRNIIFEYSNVFSILAILNVSCLAILSLFCHFLVFGNALREDIRLISVISCRHSHRVSVPRRVARDDTPQKQRYKARESSRPQFTFPDIIPRYDSPVSFPVVAKVRKETGPYAKNRRDETDGDRKPDNGIAIIVRAGLLALIKPYTRGRIEWYGTR